MTVLVFGAGAVGSLFGARFAAAGRPVLLIGRGPHVEALRAHGIRVEGVGAGRFPCSAAIELPAATPVELALLTVKTFDLGAAATALARSCAPVPLLLPQNGLHLEAIVEPALRSAGWTDPVPWIVRAVHSVPATLVGPGVVRAAGSGEIVLPEPSGDPRRDAGARAFETLFREAGFSVRTVPAIEREVWRKALVNAAINPVTALHGVPNGDLASEPLRSEALALLDEAYRVAETEPFGLSLAEARRDFDQVVRATAENRSSMLQDLDRGRPTEIEAISGEILRLGEARGLRLPATRAIVERVRAVVAGARRTAQPS